MWLASWHGLTNCSKSGDARLCFNLIKAAPPNAMAASLRLLLIALAVGEYSALPSADRVVPERLDLAAKRHIQSPTEFIEAMTNSGGTETDCRTFATNEISRTAQSVQDEQALLNAIDTGAGCASQGQSPVAAAQAVLTAEEIVLATAQGTAAVALAAKNTACDAIVNFDIPLNDLLGSHPGCLRYGQESSYQWARSICDSNKTALATAEATIVTADAVVDSAQAALDTAQADAAELVSECHCRVQKERAAAWSGTETATSAHEAEWTKAHQIVCALDQTNEGRMDECEVPACPTVTQPAAVTGVDEETCFVDEEPDCGFSHAGVTPDWQFASHGQTGFTTRLGHHTGWSQSEHASSASSLTLSSLRSSSLIL